MTPERFRRVDQLVSLALSQLSKNYAGTGLPPRMNTNAP